MSRDQPEYFSDWRTDMWDCPGCGWSGPGSGLAKEYFDELFEVHCPRCDHKFGVITHPTTEQTQRAAAAGNAEAIAHLKALTVVGQRQRDVQQAREALGYLPDLDGTDLTFTFAPEGGDDGMSPTWLVLYCGDREVYREPSGYEGWQAIIDIGMVLVDRYAGRIAWIDPAAAGDCLGGDDISYDRHIRAFLAVHHVAPPTGAWAVGGHDD
jgi:hypothetical protein